MVKCSCEVGFGCMCRIPVCLLSQGFQVEFVVSSFAAKCGKYCDLLEQ